MRRRRAAGWGGAALLAATLVLAAVAVGNLGPWPRELPAGVPVAGGSPAAEAPPPPEPPPPPPLPDSAAVSWTPDPVVQGTVFQVRVAPARGALAGAAGTFAGEPLHFRPAEGGALLALAAAPVDAAGTGELALEIDYGSGTGSRTLAVPFVAGDYRMERLTVAPEFGRPQPPEIRERISAESARAMGVSRRSHETGRMWDGPFIPPRGTRITSGFGHGRVFNGQVQSRHMGTDFGGAVGEPVLAPARGIVALVDTFYLGGNVVYLDHGDGLVTAYLHLSEQEVAEGEIVEPGQLIGRVGATGRVTGPHLHWIVRYGVITVDGTSLLGLQ